MINLEEAGKAFYNTADFEFKGVLEKVALALFIYAKIKKKTKIMR